jgi:GTPase SAR1 family protein
LKRIYRIDINDYLEYRRSSSAYITKLACLVHLFAYQSHLTKETKGQSVQMFRLIYLAMVLQAEGSQSDVRRERWLKELQYTLYTITLLLNEQKLHPNTNLTSQTSHTKLQEQKKKKTKREEEDKKRSATAGTRNPNLHLRARFCPAETPLSNGGDRTPMPEGTSVML